MSKSLAVFGACIALIALPAFADAVQEINTAAAHAGMAAAADTTKTLHFHIQHTLNCLEGKEGADFNAGPGNPCDDQGNGAIPDSSPAAQKSLKEAALKAKQALNEPDFQKAKDMAGDAQTILSR
jgi:Tfp pilus assembly protein PilE